MSKMVQIVIFGASGDLTARKLIPALFHSFCNQFFTDPIQIVGVARRSWDQENFRQQLKNKIDLSLLDPKSSSKRYWTQFIQKINYFQIDLSDGQKYFQLADYLHRSSPTQMVLCHMLQLRYILMLNTHHNQAN